MQSNNDLIYQINTHLLYELKWMIFAATEFQKCQDQSYVAFIDSASIHARNLFEFVSKNSPKNFTLAALGGSDAGRRDWETFLNNRVTHMYGREGVRPGWPDGLDNQRDDKLIVMAQTVLDLLETNGQPIPVGSVKEAYDEVILLSKDYLTNPSKESLAKLDVLYDSSRDSRPY